MGKAKKTALKTGAKAAGKVAAKGPGASRPHPNDDRRPDAPVEALSRHAAAIAKCVRRDGDALSVARIVAADAEQIESLVRQLDEAQERWVTLNDGRSTGAVASARAPVREGRDQLFDALRTFADHDATTQQRLDEIADVQNDDDLVDDTTRLLALAKRHAKHLEGTDVTAARITEIRGSVEAFRKARSGAREAPATTSAQAESRALLTARRARNRAFWSLAELVRTVARRGQYAFRQDPVKRKDYALYRRSSGTAAAETTEPT